MNITALSSASVRSLVGASTSNTASSVSSTASSQTSAATTQTSAAGAAASAPPGFAELSKAIGKLQDLAKSDPEAFEAAATEIADALREAADTAGGAGPLAELADRFDAAAKSGDASELTPQGPPEGGKGAHGPPPGGHRGPPPGGAPPPGGPPPGGPPPGGNKGPPPGGASGAQRASDAYKANSSDGPPDFSALAEIINGALGSVSG